MQKFFSDTIQQLNYILASKEYVTSVTEVHEKKVANKDVDNEVIKVEVEKHFDCKPEDLIFLIKDLISQKADLSRQIDLEKRYNVIHWEVNGENMSIDAAIEYNQKTRDLLSVLKMLSDLKSNETKKSGRDFKFNINGEQVPYHYNINVKSEIDFNRNIVRDLYKKYLEEADKISNLIEKRLISTEVEFETKYNFNDSISEVIEKYLGNTQS